MSGLAFWMAVGQQLLGLLFLVAGGAKVRSPHALRASMISLGIRSRLLLRLGPVILPWLEIGAGLALVVGVQSRAAAVLIGAMLTGFSLLLTIRLVQGHEFQCHCFGSATQGPTTWWSVVRNLGLLGLSMAVVIAAELADISVASALSATGIVLTFFLLQAAGGLLWHRSGELS